MAVPLPGDDTSKQMLFEEFGSLNVRDARTSMKDDEWAWYENVIPIGKGNLRTVYAEGSPIYTAPTGRTIIFYYHYNLNATPYIAVFLDNGTAYQINTNTSASTTISATTGTFYTVGGSLPACAQWESMYLLIVGTVTNNSYWVWNGTTLYTAGGLGPDCTVTNPGSNYTSAPTVSAFGGSGSGTSFAATVQNGIVTKVTTSAPGSGYVNNDIVQLLFTGGGSDTSAAASATIVSTGGVGAVNVVTGGVKYDTTTTISFSGGGGSGAAAVVTGLVNGVITQVTVTNPGTGYTSAPTVSAAGPSGSSGFTGLVDVHAGQVSGLTVVHAGTNFTGAPQVSISAPDLPAIPLVQATASVSGYSSSGISGFTMINEGLSYSKATVTLTGGNKAAAGTAYIMPYGISGTTIEVYQGHVWIANGTTVTFSAPGSIANFSASAGGGSFQSTDSFLRNQITRLIANSGYLYLIGDSSVNVISNVQTTASGLVATTTFSNSNIDPQIGTIWRDSVVAYDRAFVFANPTGVHACYGGSVQKVSENLDSLFASASFNTGQSGVIPTSSVATIFGIKTYVMNFTCTDPYTNTLRTFMLGWDGKHWFALSGLYVSGVSVGSSVAVSEYNSAINATASTGSVIYPLFSAANASLNKVWRSKLRYEQSYIVTKQGLRFYLAHQINDPSTYGPISIQVDTSSANNQGQLLINPLYTNVTFQNNNFLNITWNTTVAPPTSTVSFFVNRYDPEATDVQVYGQALGVTGQTHAGDVTIISMSLLYRDYSIMA